MRSRRLLWTLFFLAALVGPACGQEIVFASVEDARRLLSTSDSYTKAMSGFDRAIRMRVEREPTEVEFLAFAASAAVAWTAQEREAVEAAYNDIRTAVARLALPLPERIYIVRTSGAEDSHAAYTRQNAIMLPTRMLAKMRGQALRRLMAHELFHVASRAHPKLVDPLYATIGFRACGEVALPAALEAQRITNPDAPKNLHCIRVRERNDTVWALPVLIAAATKAEILRGGDFLEYATVVLLVVEPAAGAAPARVLNDSKGPRVLAIEDVSGFLEQAGRNTEYFIHPEEIVADNFALMTLGTGGAPSPEILARIEKVLAEYAARGAAQLR